MMRKLHYGLGIPLSLLIDEYSLEQTKINPAIQAIKDIFTPTQNYQFNIRIG